MRPSRPVFIEFEAEWSDKYRCFERIGRKRCDDDDDDDDDDDEEEDEDDDDDDDDGDDKRVAEKPALRAEKVPIAPLPSLSLLPEAYLVFAVDLSIDIWMNFLILSSVK